MWLGVQVGVSRRVCFPTDLRTQVLFGLQQTARKIHISREYRGHII